MNDEHHRQIRNELSSNMSDMRSLLSREVDTIRQEVGQFPTRIRSDFEATETRMNWQMNSLIDRLSKVRTGEDLFPNHVLLSIMSIFDCQLQIPLIVLNNRHLYFCWYRMHRIKVRSINDFFGLK